MYKLLQTSTYQKNFLQHSKDLISNPQHKASVVIAK